MRMSSKSEIRSIIDGSKLLIKLAIFGAVLAFALALAGLLVGVGSDTFVQSDIFTDFSAVQPRRKRKKKCS